jgi:hypothetical protein
MSYMYWRDIFRFSNWFHWSGDIVFDIALTGLSLGLIVVLYLYIRRRSISFSLLQRCVLSFYLLLIPHVLLLSANGLFSQSCTDVEKSNAFIYSEALVLALAIVARWTLLPAIVYMCAVIVQLYRQCQTEKSIPTDLNKD